MKSILRCFFIFTALFIPSYVGAQAAIESAEGSAIKAGKQAADSTVQTGAQVASGVGTAAQATASGVKSAADVAKEAIKSEAEKGVGGVAKDAAQGTAIAVKEIVKAVKNGDVATFQDNAAEAGESFKDKTVDLADMPIVGDTVKDLGPLEKAFKSIKVSNLSIESGLLQQKIPVGGKSKARGGQAAARTGQTAGVAQAAAEAGPKYPKLDIAQLRLDGKAAAFGVSTNFALVLDVKEKGGYVVIAPGEMKFSSLSDVFKVLDDQVGLKDVEIILSTISTKYRGVTVAKYDEGITLLGTLIIKGLIEKVLGKELKIKGTGFISRKAGLVDSEFGAEVATEFDLGAGLKTQKSRFSLKIVSLSVLKMSMATGISVPIPDQPQPLIFKTIIGFEMAPQGSMSISGEVEGEWKDAFGFPFLTVRNVGLGAAKAYASAGAPLTEFAIKGGLKLGSKEVDLMVQVKMPPAGERTVSAIGSFKGGLNLRDIVDIASSIVKEPIPANTLPDLGIKDAKLYIVTAKSVTIFGKSYSRGVYISGEATIFGKTARIVFMLDPKKGIAAEGYLEKIDLGVLKLTGAGPDKQPGNADDGLTIDIQLNTKKQAIFISGDAELNIPAFGPAVKQTVDMTLGIKGGAFKMRQEVIGFATIVDVNLPLTDIKAASIRMTGEQAAIDKMQGLFTKGLDAAKDGANSAINTAKKALDEVQNEFAPLKALEDQMHAAEDKCASAGKQLIKAAEVATKEIISAGKAVGGAIGDLAKDVAGWAGKVWNKLTGGGAKPRVPNAYEWLNYVPNKPNVPNYADLGRAASDRKVPLETLNLVLSVERDRHYWIALGYEKNWDNVAYAIKAGLPVQVIEALVGFMVGSGVKPEGYFKKNDMTVEQIDKIMPAIEMAILFAGQVGNNDAREFLIKLKDEYAIMRRVKPKQAAINESMAKAVLGPDPKAKAKKAAADFQQMLNKLPKK